jgi:hypothetical protein
MKLTYNAIFLDMLFMRRAAHEKLGKMDSKNTLLEMRGAQRSKI